MNFEGMSPQAVAVRQGLIDRGMAPHIADAFVMNFQDESGLNPSINEIQPIVPGSRGGYGLAQWTGPRRNALEAFADARSIPVSDMDLQLDFLMEELRGPEARAGNSIFAAPDTATAANAILRQFLRPAKEHQERRALRYSGAMPVQDAPQGMTQMNRLLALQAAAPRYNMQQDVNNFLVRRG